MENERNLVEDESISDSIDESSAYDNSDNESISTGALEDIWDRNHVHMIINERDSILRISEQIRQAKSARKGAELSEKWMGICLHKIFRVIYKYLNN